MNPSLEKLTVIVKQTRAKEISTFLICRHTYTNQYICMGHAKCISHSICVLKCINFVVDGDMLISAENFNYYNIIECNLYNIYTVYLYYFLH